MVDSVVSFKIQEKWGKFCILGWNGAFFPSANPPWGGGEKLLRVPAHHSGLPRTSAEFCEYLRMLGKIIGQLLKVQLPVFYTSALYFFTWRKES